MIPPYESSYLLLTLRVPSDSGRLRRVPSELFRFLLRRIPYDSLALDLQELSIELAMNCRIGGILGCELVVADDAQISVSADGFACHQLYDLDERTTVSSSECF